MKRGKFRPCNYGEIFSSLPPYYMIPTDPFSLTADPDYHRKVMGVCQVPNSGGHELLYFRCDPPDGPQNFINVDRRFCRPASGGVLIQDLPRDPEHWRNDFPTACYSAASLFEGGVSSLHAYRDKWFTLVFSAS